MKRAVPLAITAACGFVLIVAHFSPYTESWGEVTMIWFDILASIAFLLGGGNLLKIHLKRISDQAAGWAYSLITIVAFVVTLGVGLAKLGAPPAARQEYYGETFARLPVEDFPQTYSVEGTIPEKTVDARLPSSAIRQLREVDGRLVFRGWMTGDQKSDLLEYKEQLRWRCAVERLHRAAQPPEPLAGKVLYHVDHEALAFKGHMTEDDRAALAALGESDAWHAAVEELFTKSQEQTKAFVGYVPPGFDSEQATEISPALSFDRRNRVLGILGPMSVDQRDALKRQFPLARPLPETGARRAALLAKIESLGTLSEKQVEAFHAVLDGGWTVEQLVKAVDVAGRGEEEKKTACEMLAEQKRGPAIVGPNRPKGPDRRLSEPQVAMLEGVVASAKPLTARRIRQALRHAPVVATTPLGAAAVFKLLVRPPPEALASAACFAAAAPAMRVLDGLNDKQAAALEAFLVVVPTRAEQRRDLCLAMMKAGPLTDAQRNGLLEGYRDELAWKTSVNTLFAEAHQRKFPWSGDYRAAGTPFWWLYEYAFKPLTATMFAMLAFYVASAAFRAFRAKNLEATLLLATAFLILLGRTFAGAVATAWLPDWLSGLRIESLSVTIMQVFNTAGTRAIMIGIALGIASTSLKVLLGIDRSYLGSGDE